MPVRGAKRDGQRIRSGTRIDRSKNVCLNHMPRSPSISPWSAPKTMTVSSDKSALRQRIQQAPHLVVDATDDAHYA